MRFRVIATKDADRYTVQFSQSAFRLMMHSVIRASSALNNDVDQIAHFGSQVGHIRRLFDSAKQISIGETRRYEIETDLTEIHAIIAIILVVRDLLTSSEEDYNIKTGFFRDHAIDLVREIVMAISTALSSIHLWPLWLE